MLLGFLPLSDLVSQHVKNGRFGGFLQVVPPPSLPHAPSAYPSVAYQQTYKSAIPLFLLSLQNYHFVDVFITDSTRYHSSGSRISS
jgi:hypothetical protein